MDPRAITIADYDYALPQEKIADFPLPQRDASRLLVYRDGSITDDHFYNLPSHIPAGAVLFLNNTRVIEARLLFTKATGGVIEIFCLEPSGRSMEQALAESGEVYWQCLIGGASKWKTGQVLEKELVLNSGKMILRAHYVSKQSDHFIIRFTWEPTGTPFSEILHAAGAIPLPPYIRRQAGEQDKERYQTVFSRLEGSVAAPTASLHFTPAVLNTLQENGVLIDYVTLHVGAGTFKPVKTATVGEHQMHGEPFMVTRAAIRNMMAAPMVIAAGTTSLRTLESIYWLGVKCRLRREGPQWQLGQWEAYELEKAAAGITLSQSLSAILQWMEENQQDILHCYTSLLITPGYHFRVPSALITNFHQPQSTLLLLVSAFIGENWKNVYRHALQSNYRFLSYGDASLLWR